MGIPFIYLTTLEACLQLCQYDSPISHVVYVRVCASLQASLIHY